MAGRPAKRHMLGGGQTLLVTYGKGFYQGKGQPAQIKSKGDVAKIPPNAEHWHGASPDIGLTHIAISLNLQKRGVGCLKEVTPDEYEIAKRTIENTINHKPELPVI